MVTRVAVGQAAKAPANDDLAGVLLSLGTQAALTAADTPDTRSWSTLPGRIAFARVQLPPGEHTVEVLAECGFSEADVSKLREAGVIG